ncbi:3'-5' RNA nuclease TATDN2-like [Oratosquilla oratoria]|uniref:3'-5' RNA nuclease TATDN2-like n=1 Tax=Oratosquilla oratoria TaxID=337810 RepID=UPI003F7591F3
MNVKEIISFPPSFEGCIAVFCEARTFHKISWWKNFLQVPGVWAAFGCHPHFADQYDEEAEQYLRIALSQKKAVALGEIGLDYSFKNTHSKLLQMRVFKRQLKIALEMKKPLVIHCRDANEDCLEIMKKIVPRDYLIHRHCFTGDWEEASLWFENFSNVYLGFTPLITSNNNRAANLRDVASRMPLNRLLLETDAPYFRPNCLSSGLKGSSHPGMAIHVAAQVAVLRNLDLEEVLLQVRKNTYKMYNI